MSIRDFPIDLKIDTPLLALRGLRKAFGEAAHGADAQERLLLDIATLEVPQKSAIVLTGINGAGKSTLLRILAGLEPANVEWLAYRAQTYALSPYPALLRREIVYVHQHPVLFSTSLMHNIGYGLEARGMARGEIRQRVEAAMEWAGVAHLRARHPQQLSGGERQRVALARARVLDPRLLLLDEPTASLDGGAREQVIALIPELVAGGASVIMACHDRDLLHLPQVQRWKLRNGRLEVRGQTLKPRLRLIRRTR